MSQVYQRLMSDGDWEINLKPECPRAVLDKLVPFTTHVVVTPGELDATTADSVFLAAARYVGVVRRLGRNRLSPGGPGLSMWLSDPDGKGEIATSAITLTAASLSFCITATLPSSLSSGTVTSPGGTLTNTYQWVSRRDVLNSVCRTFGVEWRINEDFTVDVGTVANLYRSVAAAETPAAVVARGVGGRDAQIVGIRGDLETNIDWEEYVSRVYVIGNGTGNAGGTSPFRRPTGGLITWARVVEDPAAPVGTLATVAQSVMNLLPTDEAGRRELRVSTDLFDVAGDVVLGDDVYVWDPENGVIDTDNQVHYQGQLIYPAAMRCIGIRWPVRRGMGVYLRIQNSTLTPEYLNITPYVEFSEGAAELELGAASRMLNSDSAGNIVEVRGQVEQAPWLTYTPTISGTGTAVGNGTVTGAYRREGTTLHLRITWTLGSTSTVGAGGVLFSLPSGMAAVTLTNLVQALHAEYNDTGTATYEGRATIGSAGTTLQCFADGYNPTSGVNPSYVGKSAISTTVPHTWASTDFINVNGTIEVAP